MIFLISPSNKNVVSVEITYATIAKLSKIYTAVNTFPTSESWCTSSKPTVEIVITVINKASMKLNFSINIKPTIPTTKLVPANVAAKKSLSNCL